VDWLAFFSTRLPLTRTKKQLDIYTQPTQKDTRIVGIVAQIADLHHSK
jgi:hypothetical protein